MPKTSRFTRTLLVTLAILLVFEGGVRVAASSLPQPLTWSSEEAQAKVDHLSHPGQRPATVFVGSSVADLGLVPARFGARTYNAALRGSSMQMIDIWTTRVVVPTAQPATVVIGLSSRELTPNDGQQQRGTRDFLKAPAVRRLLHTENLVDKLDRRIGDVSRLYQYRTVLRRPLRVFGDNGTLDSGVRLTNDGWDRSSSGATYDGSAGIVQFLRQGPLGNWRLGERELAQLREMLGALERAHVRTIVVSMPVTATYVGLHPRGRTDYDQAVAAMRAEAVAAGASFVDEGVWETGWFSDPIHLNGRGAARLSAMLATQVSGPGSSVGAATGPPPPPAAS